MAATGTQKKRKRKPSEDQRSAQSEAAKRRWAKLREEKAAKEAGKKGGIDPDPGIGERSIMTDGSSLAFLRRSLAGFEEEHQQIGRLITEGKTLIAQFGNMPQWQTGQGAGEPILSLAFLQRSLALLQVEGETLNALILEGRVSIAKVAPTPVIAAAPSEKEKSMTAGGGGA